MQTGDKTAVYAEIDKALQAGRHRIAINRLLQLEGGLPLNRVSTQGLLYRLIAYNRLQWLPEASQLIKPLLAKAGGLSKVHFEIALFYVLLGRAESAEKHFKVAYQSEPGSALIATELAILSEQCGASDKAIKIYGKVIRNGLSVGKADEVFARALSRLTGLRALHVDEAEAVAALLERSRGTHLEANLCFSLAKHHGLRGDLEMQLAFLERGNSLAKEEDEASINGGYSPVLAIQQLDALKALFPARTPDWMPEFSPSERRYLFVLGMPRSGTTLLEQILGAHPLVGNSGESRAMSIALSRFSPAANGGDEINRHLFEHYRLMTSKDFAESIKYYEKYQVLLSDASIVTDKELNCVYRVGLLANMFPNAKFISIKRQPLDVATSLLQHYFRNAPYSTSALNAVIEHENYYAKVDYWRELYPERVVSLDYERLVTSPREVIADALDRIELNWDDSVMNFNERKNSVRTPSLSQVRKEFNTLAVEKWRRFKPLLGPAMNYLGVS